MGLPDREEARGRDPVSYHFINVKHYKRGVIWDNGEARMCLRCTVNGLSRQGAVVTAIRVDDKTKHRLPVAYCKRHREVIE